MNITAISMDRNIIAIGFRRVVSAAKAAGFDVRSIYFLDDADQASLAGSWWKQKTGMNFSVNYVKNDRAHELLADKVKDADVVAFSLMSVQRNIAFALVQEIRKKSPHAIIIVGGYHPTLDPLDAISFADIIVRGEGENTFVEILNRLKEGRSLSEIPNTWIKTGGKIQKNPRSPLMTPAELEAMPFMDYALANSYVFSYSKGELKPMDKNTMLRHVGTTYNTIWTVGCPNRCSFCSQSKFIDLSSQYARYRGPSAEYIIREINAARRQFPIEYAIFYDSNFIGRPLEDIISFSEMFKEKVGIKFVLSGTNPVSVTKEKFDYLIGAGLVRIKIGIEAGNHDTLKRYNRPAGKSHIMRAASILSAYRKQMAAPAFELILDNPYETIENLYETIDFLDSLPGPYTASLFSLQFMPYTPLSEELGDPQLVKKHIEKEYMFSYRPTAINILISLFAVCKPPHALIRLLKRIIRGRETRPYPRLKALLYKLMLIRRAMDQARVRDFSTFPSRVMLTTYRLKCVISALRPGTVPPSECQTSN